MPKKKKNPNVDNLFAKKQVDMPPRRVINAVSKIIRRNDELGIGSQYRVSKHRALRWIDTNMDYKLTERALCLILDKLGRRSWAHV